MGETVNGNFIDVEGGLYVPATEMKKQTGEIKTHMTQSEAGLGTQGPAVQQPHPARPIPAPTHPDMPDA